MNKLLPIVAIFSYFTPMIIFIVRNFWGMHAHLLFAIYFILNGLINLANYFELFDITINTNLALGFNVLDFPIVSVGIYMVAQSKWVRWLIKLSLPVYIGATLYSLYQYSFTPESLNKFIPYSITIVVILIIIEICHFFQKIEHTKYETSIVFILGAVFFHYASFILVYLFLNHFQDLASTKDTFTIYYCSSIISMLFAVLGYTQRNMVKR